MNKDRRIMPLKEDYLNPKFEEKNNQHIFFADFETVKLLGKQYVSCYSLVSYNGDILRYDCIEFDIDRLPQQSESLVENFLITLSGFTSKKCDIVVYFHNLVRFDIYFILELISSKDQYVISIISRNKTFYSIAVKNLSSGGIITFKDTFLLLPMGLKKLSEFYGIKIKEDFNHDNNYEDYNVDEFRSKITSYCVSDSQCLRNVFQKFRNEIYGLFKVDCSKSLTMSSLSLKIFRIKYYSPDITPIFVPNESIDFFVRESYYGGVVELYKPHMLGGWHYDVNALYPSVMKDNLYPIGKGEFVKDLSVIDIDTFFGFIEVDVMSTNDAVPFLVKSDPSNGLISPIGQWRGIYFSEELKYAKSLGYSFEIVKAVKFEKGSLFSSFVSDMYRYRLKNGKNSSLGMSVKLLMNSLYGRFGMKLQSSVTSLLTHEELNIRRYYYVVPEIVTINKKFLVTHSTILDDDTMDIAINNGFITNQEAADIRDTAEKAAFKVSSSVPIASAVTGYARILMYKYKLLCKNNLFYTDTDSIFTSVEIPDEYVSETKLGMLKLEGIVEEAYFVSPKSYMIKYSDSLVMKSKGFSSDLLVMQDYIDAYSEKIPQSKIVRYINRFFVHKKRFSIEDSEKSYTFRSNLNKRRKIYDPDGIWIDSEPIMVHF